MMLHFLRRQRSTRDDFILGKSHRPISGFQPRTWMRVQMLLILHVHSLYLTWLQNGVIITNTVFLDHGGGACLTRPKLSSTTVSPRPKP